MQPSSPSLALVLLAGGRGTRFQQGDPAATDKLWILIKGKPFLQYSLEAFLKTNLFQTVCCVVPSIDDKERFEKEILQSLAPTLIQGVQFLWAIAGNERAESVRNGIKALEPINPAFVMIHDGARPAIHPDAIVSLYQSLETTPNAILAARVTDTLKLQKPDQTIQATIDRQNLWQAQTPQAFTFKHLMEAYTFGFHGVTDEASLMEKMPHPVALIENLFPNPKLTYKKDLEYLEYLLT
jgi:2-C-methyl-D-erythritol 4-phosphate cytidylyltransferase